MDKMLKDFFQRHALLGLSLVGRQEHAQTRRAAKREQGPADHRIPP